MWRSAARIALALVAAVAALGGWMLMFERSYIYFPDPTLAARPDAVGLPYTELHFAAADGTALHGWHIPAAEGGRVVLHFHGNAGNISHRLHLYRRWHDLGLGVLAFDYRGYGESAGSPDEAGLHADARAAWALLTGELGVSPDRVIVAGRSIGCALATRLAGEHRPAGVALETPFTSVPDMARHHYPWLPFHLLVRSRFDTLATVRDIRAPLLIVAAEDDAIAPPDMARRIFLAAPVPKRFAPLPGGHNDFDVVSAGAYAETWREWLDSLSLPPGGTPPDKPARPR